MKVHLIGVVGIGVGALARYLLRQGWEVAGSDSDQTFSPLLQDLKRDGIRVKLGYRKSNLNPETNLVIYTEATPPDNPELKEAKRLGIKVLSYPQALGKLTLGFHTIALAGTHGKSTTTALIALVLMEARFDPTVIMGTKLKELGDKSFRSGKSKYLIIEADEYKDAFLNYYPQATLITNIDREHLDYFKDLNQIKRSFLQFINNLGHNGILILNQDSAPLFSLRKRIKRKIVWYSLREKELAKKIKKHLRLAGEHNLSNALGVYKLAKNLGLSDRIILRAFSKYQGSWRRMEYKGEFKQRGRRDQGKVHVYDDYAHHPTEIRATINAFREKFPKAVIICVFQPHQAERLKKLFKDFAKAFDKADALVLLDVFKVAGREAKIRRSRELNSRKLAEAIKKRSSGPKAVAYLPYSRDLPLVINEVLEKSQIANNKLQERKEAVVVMMGAGNIVDLTPRLIK